MAGTFPTLSWGSSALYPATLGVSGEVKISKFLDGSEQRSRTTAFLRNWQLQLNSIKKVDLDSLETFWDANKGDFDSSWTFPLDGSTNMVFTDPTFPAPETIEGRYSLTLNMRQTITSGTYATGTVTAFPAFSSGVLVQFPFTRQAKANTTKSRLRGGGQVAWSHFATQPMIWPLQYSLIVDSEASGLFDLYAKLGGAYRTVTFTDPNTGVTYPKVRFAPAPIQRTYLGLNRNSVSFVLEQVLN